MTTILEPMPVALVCPKCRKRHIDDGGARDAPHRIHICIDDATGKGCCAIWEFPGLPVRGADDVEIAREMLELKGFASPEPWWTGVDGKPYYQGFYAVIAPHEESDNHGRMLLQLNGNFPVDDDARFIAFSRSAGPVLARAFLAEREKNARLQNTLHALGQLAEINASHEALGDVEREKWRAVRELLDSYEGAS